MISNHTWLLRTWFLVAGEAHFSLKMSLMKMEADDVPPPKREAMHILGFVIQSHCGN